MWSIINRAGQLLGLTNSEPPVDLNAIYAVLDAEEVNINDHEIEDSVPVSSKDVACQHRVGTITELFENHGFIKTEDADSNFGSQLYFNRKDAPSGLNVGNQVVFLAFRTSDENDWIVRKILYVENEFWDKKDNVVEEVLGCDTLVKKECETAYKHVIAKISGRQGRTVFAGNQQFSLDSVQIDFIPVEGDWVMLESLVETQQTEDTLLLVNRVLPVRAQHLEGKVSHWNPDIHRGIINREVHFSKDSCEPGYLPKVGDEVAVYSIESEQGQLTWRAVHVVPTLFHSLKLPHDPKVLATLLQDKHGIIISEDTNCGILAIGQEKQIKVEVKNESNSLYTLCTVELIATESQFQLVEPPEVNARTILPGDNIVFIFRCKGRFIGRTTDLVVFKFEGFEIGRQLVVDVENASQAITMSDQGGRKTQRNKQEPLTAKKLLATRNGFIVPGVRPIKPASFVPVNLGMFTIPEKLVNTVLSSETSTRKEEVINRLLEQYPFLSEPDNRQHYMLRWDNLIHLEELEHSVNIARYNTQASLHRVQDYLSLEIPGLAERRPSLVVGDRVVVHEGWTDENSWVSNHQIVGYEGFIHKVLSNEILMKFNPGFHETCSGVYSLKFEASRTKYRREHQAIHVVFSNLSADWLFPSCVTYQSPQIVITHEEDYVDSSTKNKKEMMDNKILTNEEITLNYKNDSRTEIKKMSDAKLENETLYIKKTNMVNDSVPVDSTLLNRCDRTVQNNKLLNKNYNLAPNKFLSNNYKDIGGTILSNEELISVEKSVDDILSTATNIINSTQNHMIMEGKPKSTELKESIDKHVKSKVSDIFVRPSSTDKSQRKNTPPRVPVVNRFLQNGNCPSSEKSPKEVRHMLQQLASLSLNENVPNSKHSMKTLDEIEHLLLDSSTKKGVISGIKLLPKSNEGSMPKKESDLDKSVFEPLLDSTANRNNINKIDKNNSFRNYKNMCNSFDFSENNQSFVKTEEKYKNYVKDSKTTIRNKDKIKWNSNIEMKIGNEKEAYYEIPIQKRRSVKWFNPLLNHHQKEAVRNILKGEARPLPYIIFGPPGTGKTITLVEAILQVYFLIPQSRLLIGTPSNSSADLLCERLLDCGLLLPGDLLRLVGYQYTEQGRVPEWLRPYCGNADIKARDDYQELSLQDGVVNLSRHAIGRHRITIGTCNSLGVLYQMGFPRGHFTHVFIDEAGQATEPEILIPLAFLHKSYGQVVLAGDPLQLGPVVLSKISEHFGLGESLLVRLLQRTPYCRDIIGYPTSGGYNPHLVTRLVYNYRSLPEILSLPNQMFYDGDLIPQVCEISSEEAHLLTALREVLPLRPGSKPPALVFHGVRGTNCQAPDSPSWYNPHEVVQTAMYLQSLYSNGLTPDQCGILTPYQAQALKIRNMLEALDMQLPKVGSVEEFQGQERMAIILSTVRSSPRLIEADIRHTIGFVASPRRLNVAITRARAVLIIVGNPHLLAQDQYWRTVLSYCVDNHAYTGCNLPDIHI